ncbi:MAG: SRPBCC family protein [Actinomycetota bacterium]
MTTKNESRAEIEIDADPDTVWSVLTDFGAYPDWNPFITSIDGDQTMGGTLHVRLQPPEGRGITMDPAVTVNEPGRVFAWLGKLGGVPHLFDGAHRFELEPVDSGRRTRFVQSEQFQGFLLPFVRRSVLPATLRGFEAMNRVLADRAVAMKAAAA